MKYEDESGPMFTEDDLKMILKLEVIVGIVVMGWSIVMAIYGYEHTPSVYNFWFYVNPGSTKTGGKVSYFYSLVFLQLFGVISSCFVVYKLNWPIPKNILQCVFGCVFLLIALFGQYTEVKAALAVALVPFPDFLSIITNLI